VTRKPLGPTGRWRRVHKPLGPIGRMEMEKGPICTRDMQAVGSHRSDGDGEICNQVPQVGWRWRKAPQVQVTHKLSGPTGQVEKGPTGTRHLVKGSSEDFYNELQVLRMSNLLTVVIIHYKLSTLCIENANVTFIVTPCRILGYTFFNKARMLKKGKMEYA
jgi:hypothetical protein